MSSIEDFIIAPWIGRTCCRNSLTIAVLSLNSDIIKNVSEALVNVHEIGDYKWKLMVLRAFDLESIVRQSCLTGKIGIDFVIIAIDTSRMFCIEWAGKIIKQVHPDLRIRRVVLVNATGLAINTMAVSASELINFCTENRLEMLNSNVSKVEDAQFVARRLLKYIEVSFGVKTGVPNLNI